MDNYTIVFKVGNTIYDAEVRANDAKDAVDNCIYADNVIAVLPTELYEELPEGAMLGRVSF